MPDGYGVVEAPVAEELIVGLESESIETAPRRISWHGVLLIHALVYGGIARLALTQYLTPHIDEPASVLAAKMVAEKGLPIFPSGVPYFQGAVLSYLLAPLLWLFNAGVEDLQSLRYVSVVIGILTIVATYFLGRQVSGQTWVGVVAAIIIATDPVSGKWSALVRMYAPLELFAVLFLWIVAVVLMNGPTRRRLALIVIFFWLGIFSHIAMVLIWPAAALMALVTYGRSLLRERRDVSLALGLAAGAPIALTLCNRIFSSGGASASAGGELPGISFVGDHLLRVSSVTQPSFRAWQSLFTLSALAEAIPLLLMAVSVLLCVSIVFNRSENGPSFPFRVGTGLVLSAHWIPVVLVGTLTSEIQERYVIHTLPSAAVIFALAFYELTRRIVAGRVRGDDPDWMRIGTIAMAGALAFLLVAHQASGALGLQRRRALDPDYIAASQWVAERRSPNEPVYASMVTAPYLVLGGDEELYFLAGHVWSFRFQRYVRLNGDGEWVDYWIGVPSVFLMNDLCRMALDNPNAWIITDILRLESPLNFGEEYLLAVWGLTYEVYRHETGVYVLRPAEPEGRVPYAEQLCARVAELAGQGVTELTFEGDTNEPLRFGDPDPIRGTPPLPVIE